MKDVVISGKTTVCGIIGDPVEHTVSPALHNAAFRQMDLDYVYTAFRVGAEGLGGAINGMRGLGIRGLSVTIPHKVGVAPMLDELDPLAKKIGAVNCIVNEGGHLTGHNTDGAGFIQALYERDVEPQGKKVAVLGAGGAARAVAFALAEDGAALFIMNRTREKAMELADRISDAYGIPIVVGPLDRETMAQTVADADIVVNCTSLGMVPDARSSPVPADFLCANQTVVDIVYNPLETRLLREARERGARTLSGLDMLVWQGALAFQLWTGLAAPVDVMRDAGLRVLRHEK